VVKSNFVGLGEEDNLTVGALLKIVDKLDLRKADKKADVLLGIGFIIVFIDFTGNGSVDGIDVIDIVSARFDAVDDKVGRIDGDSLFEIVELDLKFRRCNSEGEIVGEIDGNEVSDFEESEEGKEEVTVEET